MTVAPRGASTPEPMSGRNLEKYVAVGAQDLAGSVPTRALALRGALILVVPPASTNAGCG
jgi:hypothetical protein